MGEDRDHGFECAFSQVRRRAERYAGRGPYFLFPDEVVVRNVLVGMARNLLEHGKAYCPCREVTGDEEADRANVCPCRSHHEDIARDGHCECRLFVSEDFLRRRSV
jgi:ferredoxin-thioredoxin reductase catalytic chain